MPQEYVSTSKAAVKTMAEKLAQSKCENLTGDEPVVKPRIYEKADKVVIIENFSGNFTM